MGIGSENWGRDERVLQKLRRLYEQRGFCRVRTSRFEEYALYVENKNFLDTESIITFMDLDGKLMALKPDATLSIVKNIPRGGMPATQKLYYIEEVYRLSPENREYKVHSQIGVESIGLSDAFSNLETLDLALESLRCIGPPFALDVSHLGFVSGLLSELELGHRIENRLLGCIHAKNTWDIARVLEEAEVPEEKRHMVLELSGIHGNFANSLAQARALVCNDQMQEACDELEEVAKVLGREEHIGLDFSVINDLDYYNGLIFRGYVEGVPSVVLTGGRYDNLMRRMNKRSGAIGFAVSLDPLGTYLESGKQHDFDTLITYPEPCDYAQLLGLAKELGAKGERVRLERESSDLMAAGLSFFRHLRYRDGVLEEVEIC